MKANEFDDIMKKILENPPDFPLDEATKADMLGKLDAQQINHSATNNYRIALVAGLLILPLLGIAWSFYTQLNNAHAKINTLEKQIASINENSPDTVIQERIVYEPIEKAAPKAKFHKKTTALSNADKQFAALEKSTFFNSSGVLNSKENKHDPILAQKEMVLQELNAARNKEKALFSKNRNLHQASAEKINSKPFSHLASSWSLEQEDFPMHPAHTPLSHWWMQPVGFAVGLSAGLGQHALEAGLNTLGNSIGFRGEVRYGNRLSLIVGWEQLRLNAQIDQEEKLANFPEVAPYDPTDEFQEMEADLTAIQMPLGIKYNLFKANRFHPYFGAGILIQSKKQEKYSYQYKNADDITYYLNNDLKDNQTNINHLFGIAGASYNWNDNWTLQVEGNLNFSVRSDESFRYTSLRTSILYNF